LVALACRATGAIPDGFGRFAWSSLTIVPVVASSGAGSEFEFARRAELASIRSRPSSAQFGQFVRRRRRRPERDATAVRIQTQYWLGNSCVILGRFSRWFWHLVDAGVRGGLMERPPVGEWILP
jgi:hypothetical protein